MARGIEALGSYGLIRDRIDGADGIAYVRGRYAITLRPVGAPAPLSDEGDFLGDLAERVRRRVAHHRGDVEHVTLPGVCLTPPLD